MEAERRPEKRPEETSVLVPEWLESLLRVNFYKPCPNHTEKLCCFFCYDCKESTFCETCSKKHQDPNHMTFRVHKASHHPGLRIPDIGRYYDIYGRGKSGAKHMCKQCGWGLNQADSKFCSIGCKVGYSRGNPSTSTSGMVEDEEITRSPDVNREWKEVPSRFKDFVVTKRKTRRKGIPRRSPLF